MMPNAVPCASVSMRIVYAGWAREAGVRNGAFSEMVHLLVYWEPKEQYKTMVT